MKVKNLIVGLGNPGDKYMNTRHNVGFMVLDRLGSDFKHEKKFNADICYFSPRHSRDSSNEALAKLEGGNPDSGSAFVENYGTDRQTRMTNERDIILMKPQTFMNSSGEAVRAFIDYYKLDPQGVWVVHDDVDIPFGEIRVRKGDRKSVV